MFKAGILVKHPIYGTGTVEDSRYGGYQLYVKFVNGKKVWLRRDELTLSIGQDKISSGISRGTVARDHDKNGVFKSRRMIEAFRLGIVPFDCVEDFTFGRNEEINEIKHWLDGHGDNSLIIHGDYGTGKTHLFNHINALALRSGYAVAYVSVSQDECPFYKPKRVFGELAKTFKIILPHGGGTLNYRQFIRAVLDKGGYQDHYYFSHLANGAKNELWGWIEANEAAGRPVEWITNGWGNKYPQSISVPSLYDQAKAANIYCYILSSLGYAAKRYYGLKGLLLLFDESEWIRTSNYTYQQSMAYNLLRGLILTADEESVLLKRPYDSIHIYGLEYAKYAKDVAFLYKRECGLKLLFAFTDLSIIKQVTELQSIQAIYLNTLGIEYVHDLSRKLCSVYVDAYPHFPFKDITYDMDNIHYSTRFIVKQVVESLDIQRYHKSMAE